MAFSGACSQARPGWTERNELTAESDSKRRLAERARDALAQQLQQELAAAISQGGPARGIEVCKSRAPAIAMAVGEAHGLRIGRTSARLRNPDNQPPDWALGAVGSSVQDLRIFQSEAGELGALFPIRLEPQCVLCHGPEGGLQPEVRSALSNGYPTDAATGFRVGDLRGWFWVEVP